jgi:hypothetical protein
LNMPDYIGPFWATARPVRGRRIKALDRGGGILRAVLTEGHDLPMYPALLRGQPAEILANRENCPCPAAAN